MGQIGVVSSQTSKLVYRCGPYTQFKLDENSKPFCDAPCRSDGQRFANPMKPASYIVCTLNAAANAYIKISFNCPKEFIFNARKNECVFDISAIRTSVESSKKKLEKYDEASCGIEANTLKCTGSSAPVTTTTITPNPGVEIPA